MECFTPLRGKKKSKKKGSLCFSFVSWLNLSFNELCGVYTSGASTKFEVINSFQIKTLPGKEGKKMVLEIAILILHLLKLKGIVASFQVCLPQ